MSDKQSCHSRVSDNELILVRWQDEQDGGWREGVVCAVVDCDGQIYTDRHDIYVEATHGDFALECTAILYDRHRNERAIVPLAKVQIVEPRCEQDCDVCEGTGELRVAKWMTSGGEIVQCRLTTDCLVCHGSGKRA